MPIEYADSLDKILNAFEPEPLDSADLKTYYYDGTMESRTGDEYDSPLDDLADACVRPSQHNAHLLLGHRGCGKSTELNRLRDRLKDEGYPVIIIRCITELDILALSHWDIMVVISDVLCQIADKEGCNLGELQDKLLAFFNEIETIQETSKKGSLAVEANVGLGTPGPLKPLLNLFAGLKSELKTGYERREKIRERVEKRSSEWIAYIQELNAILTTSLQGKQPILIFEDLDKIAEPEKVWHMFSYGPLAEMPFPVIYTFPIDLFYDGRFQGLEGRFKHVVLPLIKIRDQNGKQYDNGIAVIKKILERRSNIERLFTPKVLEELIIKTGGSLRELFSCIDQCASRALRRVRRTSVTTGARIELEDAQRVLTKLQSDLSRMIERRQYAMLAKIHQEPKEARAIEDKAMLLELMRSHAVLEYNRKRWCAVHPLIVDFLEELGEIKTAQTSSCE